MSSYNHDEKLYELSDYQQFQVKWLGHNVDDSGREVVNDYGYWTVTGLTPANREYQIFWRITNREGMTHLVATDELSISRESGHRKHCLATAMLSFIENWRDAEDISTSDFISTMQGGAGEGPVPLNAAREYLADGISTCICFTTKGLI